MQHSKQPVQKKKEEKKRVLFSIMFYSKSFHFERQWNELISASDPTSMKGSVFRLWNTNQRKINYEMIHYINHPFIHGHITQEAAHTLNLLLVCHNHFVINYNLNFLNNDVSSSLLQKEMCRQSQHICSKQLSKHFLVVNALPSKTTARKRNSLLGATEGFFFFFF